MQCDQINIFMRGRSFVFERTRSQLVIRLYKQYIVSEISLRMGQSRKGFIYCSWVYVIVGMYKFHFYILRQASPPELCQPGLIERAYLSSRVDAGSAFFHAAMTRKTPTFLHDWKRPPCHVVCIRFLFLVLKTTPSLKVQHVYLFAVQDLLQQSGWQMQASAITRERVESQTHTFGLTFPGEF